METVVLGGWKVGEGVAPAHPGVEGSGWALWGPGGRGSQAAPPALPRPGEVVIWKAAPALPAHRRTGAALPQARGSQPPGWELEAAGEKSGTQSRAAAAAEKLPAALGGVQRAAKSGRAAAAVRAKFWVARKGAARAAEQSRVSCGGSRKATPGGSRRTRREGDSGSGSPHTS